MLQVGSSDRIDVRRSRASTMTGGWERNRTIDCPLQMCKRNYIYYTHLREISASHLIIYPKDPPRLGNCGVEPLPRLLKMCRPKTNGNTEQWEQRWLLAVPQDLVQHKANTCWSWKKQCFWIEMEPTKVKGCSGTEVWMKQVKLLLWVCLQNDIDVG